MKMEFNCETFTPNIQKNETGFKMNLSTIKCKKILLCINYFRAICSLNPLDKTEFF